MTSEAEIRSSIDVTPKYSTGAEKAAPDVLGLTPLGTSVDAFSVSDGLNNEHDKNVQVSNAIRRVRIFISTSVVNESDSLRPTGIGLKF